MCYFFQLGERGWNLHVVGSSLVGLCITFHFMPWDVFCIFTTTFQLISTALWWQVSLWPHACTKSEMNAEVTKTPCVRVIIDKLDCHHARALSKGLISIWARLSEIKFWLMSYFLGLSLKIISSYFLIRCTLLVLLGGVFKGYKRTSWF